MAPEMVIPRFEIRIASESWLFEHHISLVIYKPITLF